jgi:DNA polymerase (family 10)
LGPKKAKLLIDELEIRTWGELEYACRENRLVGLKGFGEKAQAKILEQLQFLQSTRGQARWVDADATARTVLKKAKGRAEIVGALARRLEVVDGIDVLVEKKQEFKSDALPVRVHVSSGSWGYDRVKLSSTEEFWLALGAPAPFPAKTEEEFFAHLKVPFVAPEMRETEESVKLARAGKLADVLPWDGVRGIFHNHTTYSDGTASVEEMVAAARDLGYSYIGISDHSQSAFYAQGLKSDALKKQEKEIRKAQDKFPDIRVFWGIESDILADGALDYPAAELKKFDFVIASIHSRFQMDGAQMTERMLKAIRNPATRFVGHLTGRLLLGRKGYALDIDKIARECAKLDVAIEINAHPSRLDIDWRQGGLLREYGTKVSINPDAHEIEGLKDVEHGVAVARKALLPTGLVVNARSAKEVASWLARK